MPMKRWMTCGLFKLFFWKKKRKEMPNMRFIWDREYDFTGVSLRPPIFYPDFPVVMVEPTVESDPLVGEGPEDVEVEDEDDDEDFFDGLDDEDDDDFDSLDDDDFDEDEEDDDGYGDEA